MNMLLIKELSERLQISARTIRYYEEKGLITPAKQESSGYRLFTEQDAARLQTIVSLREVGMSLEEIGCVLAEMEAGDSEDVLHHLELQRAVLFSQMVEIRHSIETTDRIIAKGKEQAKLEWDDIYEWTASLRYAKKLRSSWRDHWNYDSHAVHHDERVEKTQQQYGAYPSYRTALQKVLEAVQPKKGEKGVDLGTGTGNLAALFMENGIEMKGMDQSIAMLREAERKHPGYEVRLGNFLAIPYDDYQFDFAVMSYALHHLTEDQKLLALLEIKRILKPHGRIGIVDFMFEDHQAREEYLHMLREDGRDDVITDIEKSYYADRSRLTSFLEEQGYVTKTKEIQKRLHLIYAVPVRGYL
ncbi:MerR family transcriptional regulator [Paenibacillus polygoni]|uniref:MerR family transcriptional regulator n=1 Tax=Paenibacillus polygoni TaxID=3050112 RepID=A0ABY8X1Y9_9BACL|nr:MerR family transcriptional regulator [Paenibacillus polygoni]WIV19008.1 MerR family transcriptional regulator [Paenibacillus polygoni]